MEDRLAVATVWVAMFIGSAAAAVMWTGMIFMFMRWPLHTVAITAAFLVSVLLAVICQEKYQRLRRAQPPAATVIAVSERPIELRDLRDALGEETYQELSQLSSDRVIE